MTTDIIGAAIYIVGTYIDISKSWEIAAIIIWRIAMRQRLGQYLK
jgi:hypothetical protein